MDRTQQNRITLKFLEEMELTEDYHASIIIDLISNYRYSSDPLADLRKASLYMLRLLDKCEEQIYDEQTEVETDPRGNRKTKVLRLYDKDC